MTHYEILQVSPRAEASVIKAAYRALVKSNANDNRHMLSLNAAYEVIGDEDKRARYDKERNEQIGKIIGQYRILSLIAEGGFGKTYLGEHLILKTPVCIKHASAVSTFDEQIMYEEAKAIWDLRHFGMPAIRDLLKLSDGSVVLIMSYIPGPTLQQLVEKHHKIDPEHVAWIADRIFNVLRYLHLHGVVHGDVKPHNIIIQPERHQVVLVDYGLSMIRPVSDGNNKGYTPYFASPEQMNGGTLLPESDFYGLGMSLVSALGGNIENKSIPVSVPDPMIL